MSFLDNYVMGEELGKGAYATVYKCTHKQRGDVWAVKVVDKTKAGPKDISDVQHEVNIMKQLGHNQCPFIVSLLEFYDTKDKMFIVMELIEGGPLFDRIIKLKHYSETVASRLTKNFLYALQHCHSKGIVHRDLKPENLLLKKTEGDFKDDVSHLTTVAVADFGLAGKPPATTCCGSPSYIAPEVINVGYLRASQTPYDCKADIWSLGVITYILLSGKMPFSGRNYKETFAKIVKGQWTFVGDVWDRSVSNEAKDFIKLMLTLDPAKRPSAAEALQHPWIASSQSDMHMDASLANLKTFCAEQKLKGAMMVFRATTTFLGKMDNTPPFMKYLRHEDKTQTVVLSQSQTNRENMHTVDFGRILTCDTPGFKMQSLCSCTSEQVCRHIQNVYEYLFVGARDLEVYPVFNDIEVMRDDTEVDLNDDPKNEELKRRLQRLDHVLKCAALFKTEFEKIPSSEKKPNFYHQQKEVSKEGVMSRIGGLRPGGGAAH